MKSKEEVIAIIESETAQQQQTLYEIIDSYDFTKSELSCIVVGAVLEVVPHMTSEGFKLYLDILKVQFAETHAELKQLD